MTLYLRTLLTMALLAATVALPSAQAATTPPAALNAGSSEAWALSWPSPEPSPALLLAEGDDEEPPCDPETDDCDTGIPSE